MNKQNMRLLSAKKNVLWASIYWLSCYFPYAFYLNEVRHL